MRIRKTVTTVIDIEPEEDEDVHIDGLALNADGNVGVLSQEPESTLEENRTTVFYYDDPDHGPGFDDEEDEDEDFDEEEDDDEDGLDHDDDDLDDDEGFDDEDDDLDDEDDDLDDGFTTADSAGQSHGASALDGLSESSPTTP